MAPPFSSRSVAPLLPILLLAACGESPGGSAATPSTPAVAAAKPPTAAEVDEARATFGSLCSTCHGTSGHGDGPGAQALEPKPRSFADAAWQASVTDDHIKKVIVFGGAAVGKSPMMPAQPQYKGKDAVLDALVQIVRSFKGK